jgi:hypothetical protein
MSNGISASRYREQTVAHFNPTVLRDLTNTADLLLQVPSVTVGYQLRAGYQMRPALTFLER